MGGAGRTGDAFLFFSVFLGVDLSKVGYVCAAATGGRRCFLRVFRAGKGLPEPKAVGSMGSPLETVYAAGYRELSSQLVASNPHAE